MTTQNKLFQIPLKLHKCYWGLAFQFVALPPGLALFVPLFLVLPLGSVVISEFQGLAFAAKHGAAVADAGHHQLDAVPQQRHGGGGSCVRPRV